MQNLFIFLYSTKCRMNPQTKILEKSVTNVCSYNSSYYWFAILHWIEPTKLMEKISQIQKLYWFIRPYLKSNFAQFPKKCGQSTSYKSSDWL